MNGTLGDMPDPVPLDAIRDLVERAGGVAAASRMTHTDVRTMARWYSGASQVPWSVAQVLGSLLAQ